MNAWNCLGIAIDYSTRSAFEVKPTDYADNIKRDFPCKTLELWANKIFLVKVNSHIFEKEKSYMSYSLHGAYFSQEESP